MRSRGEFETVLQLASKDRRDLEISNATGIPRRTISGWRRGTEGYILARPGDICPCAEGPRLSEPQYGPYAYLLGLYLGDGCISAGRRGVWHIRITLDARLSRNHR